MDKTSLRKAFFQHLDQILINTPENLFDKTYWGNIFYEGIDPLIEVPRDIVRITNALIVTYPSVKGEVNPIDFIALEILRIKLPELYNTIRSNSSSFVGHRNEFDKTLSTQLKQFHENWLSNVPSGIQEGIKDMMKRLFPKLEFVFFNITYGAEWEEEWRKSLNLPLIPMEIVDL